MAELKITVWNRNFRMSCLFIRLNLVKGLRAGRGRCTGSGGPDEAIFFYSLFFLAVFGLAALQGLLFGRSATHP